VGGADGDFRIHPTEGAPPLTVDVNMCHSTDPNPGVSLHYHVTWGDGSDDRGFCRFTHVYPTDGTFGAAACVWDEIPAHAPGDCHNFTVGVASAPTRHSPSVCTMPRIQLGSGTCLGAPPCFGVAGTTWTITPGDLISVNSSPGTSDTIFCPGGTSFGGGSTASGVCPTGGVVLVEILDFAPGFFSYTTTACP
jgi:hypothetical protein